MAKTCKNCKYFHEESGSNQKVCVYNPPKAYPVQTQNPLTNEVGVQVLSLYPPITNDSPVCSKFVSKSNI